MLLIYLFKNRKNFKIIFTVLITDTGIWIEYIKVYE